MILQRKVASRQPLLHPLGDHLSALNIVARWLQQKRYSHVGDWTRKYSLRMSVLVAIGRSFADLKALWKGNS